jgi:2,4-dienoyl-CoA reductase-like NADH-dependent reductase (Old Yellow Enzyme family)
MAAHARFHYASLDALQADCARLGVTLPASDDLSILATPCAFGSATLPNRLVVQPMEGCDGEADGRPGPLTIRRYERFAGGGAGLLWVEACAVVPEGRANPRQLWITRDNLDAYKALVEMMRTVAKRAMGPDFEPIFVLQLTHSGRYSKPAGVPAPLIAHRSPIDAVSHVDDSTPIVTDDYLDHLQDAYVAAALLAQEAGFHGVDLKACHRYLVSELLASHTRDGRYGGSYEHRTRFLREITGKVRAAAPGLVVTTRMNLYDALAMPYGWGMAAEGTGYDLADPLRLIGELAALGMPGLNTTVGNPYYNPHVNRPYDKPIAGRTVPEEHPLESLTRFLAITRTAQQAYPHLPMVGSGYSWLRQFFPQVAAGAVAQGWASLVGGGRLAFAYPDFPRDILRTGALDPKKVCIACSNCTQIMRDGGMAGCTVRDAAVYGPIYKAGRAAEA